MHKEKQTVKHRIFISNTRMVLVTLSLFLFVNIFVINLYENTYKNSMIGSSELADNTEQIRNILADWNTSPKEEAINNLAAKLNRYGYSICVEMDGEVIYSNTDFSVSELINYLGDYLETDGKMHVYVQDYMTVITQYDMNEKMKVYAIAGEYHEFWPQKNSMTTVLILLLIDGIFCIGALLIISQIFTKRLIEHITNPLAVLSEGAKRMKEGNYSEPVKYKGDIEFEYVCEAFNEMQEHITEANAKKESYEKMRVEMVAGISHDLRTPLTAIRGTIKGLKDGVATTPELREKFLDTAYKRTIEMDLLLERLFYFSKLETGNMPLFFEKTEWSEYLEAYVKRYELSIENESLKINLKDVKTGLFSKIDREQMERILDNILENSKKYAETDKLEITINIFDEHAYVVLEISDNGGGVSEDKIPHIFEQFFRGDESRNIKEGNGLGLYIVKYLVNAMGGLVDAENSNGLTIRIRLPILDVGGDLDECKI
ncbi:HAMP domain-containing sensor histidine kinase [Anaerocolumna sp. AGMB13025]|uniref:HAMP domain-containing sensor histidine kinase n=1 Tax=Anaerocolumna sp. AGMB13025 TaxID=3039116 RepID=UPI00241C3F94|nr:HAMP domain-containing sensor histidine kinase [Anaerocolumna sp. AGMB13025]WFR55866.1 HAMP domain-containing sensor histidine kinase [Anaerocolumna sp. AGMB13025]